MTKMNLHIGRYWEYRPIPGEFSLLSIGACIVSNPAISIYRELKPISSKHDLEAIAVTGLNLENLK